MLAILKAAAVATRIIETCCLHYGDAKHGHNAVADSLERVGNEWQLACMKLGCSQIPC